MKITNDALMASIRTAVADQRAATLAFDPVRLATANSRLDNALAQARRSMSQGSMSPPNADPGLVEEIKSVQREFSANADLIRQASGPNLRALGTLIPDPSVASTYDANGETSGSPNVQPIAIG